MRGEIKLKSNDLKNRDEIRLLMQQAIKENDTENFIEAFNQMLECIEEDVKKGYQEQIEDIKSEFDSRVLSERGVRQLTSKETEYYQKLAEAMRDKNPMQALTNLDVVMPETIIDAVFEQLKTAHPLLSHIQFMATGGAIKMLMNTNGHQEAAWGDLCDEIIKELTSGFKEVDTGLLKLSAFLPVCKAMLDLGPQWLDNYVRQVLYEALANGLEAGVVTGDGNGKPIGMIRQVGDGVTVTGGVYPEKTKISVTDLTPSTIGNLLSLIAVDENGKSRQVQDLILIVNPQDYFQKVMPATTLMAPDGTYRNDIMPYPMTVIQSAALSRGDAVLGIGYRYFAAAGTSQGGQIEYSDHYKFLEDQRIYLIKAYANGMPLDNNAFLYLDISGLRPATYKVETVTAPEASNVNTLSDLKIGNLTLSPAFASATTSYTTTTTNTTNVVTAMPTDAGAEINITVKDKDNNSVTIDNGSAATWGTGANTVTIDVTAADGKSKKTYTVTVTKS